MSRFVLIAQEDTFSRRLLADELRERGWDVLEAHAATEVLEQLRTHSPACAILDLSLQNLDCRDVLQIIRNKNLSTEVIVLADGMNDETQEQHCRELGASGYLMKNALEWDELIKHIEVHLQHVKQ